ncbi:MAG: hypothetical protein LBT82_01295 [Oscillospiraceae bacterium]|jgi:chromosome segregation ATPase|nr:hypothetical protein [Oscillospiraceae bacterium]
MKTKGIKEFYVNSNKKKALGDEILKLRKKYPNKQLSHDQAVEFIKNDLIPLAKKHGYSFTLEDCLDLIKKENTGELNEEELLRAAGGGRLSFKALSLASALLLSGSAINSSISNISTKNNNNLTALSTKTGYNQTKYNYMRNFNKLFKTGFSTRKPNQSKNKRRSDKNSSGRRTEVLKKSRSVIKGTSKKQTQIVSHKTVQNLQQKNKELQKINNEIGQKNAEIEKLNNQLEQNKIEKNKNFKDLTTQVQQLKNKIQQLDKEKTDLNKQLNSKSLNFNMNKEKIKKYFTKLKEKILQKDSEIKKLINKLQQTEINQNALKQENEKLKDTISLQNQQVNNLQQSINKLKNTKLNQEDYSSLMQKLTILRQKNSELTKQILNYQTSGNSEQIKLKEKLEEANKIITSLKDKISKMEANQQNLEKENIAYKYRTQKQNQENKELQRDISTQKQQISDLQQKINTKSYNSNEVEYFKQRITSLQQENNELSKQLNTQFLGNSERTKLKEKLKNSNITISTLERKIYELENDRNNLLKTGYKMLHTCRALKKRNEDSSAKNKDLIHKIKTLESQILLLKKTPRDSETDKKIKKLQKALKQARALLSQTQQGLGNMQENIRNGSNSIFRRSI